MAQEPPITERPPQKLSAFSYFSLAVFALCVVLFLYWQNFPHTFGGDAILNLLLIALLLIPCGLGGLNFLLLGAFARSRSDLVKGVWGLSASAALVFVGVTIFADAPIQLVSGVESGEAPDPSPTATPKHILLKSQHSHAPTHGKPISHAPASR